ncbi:hypothetical protein GH714_018808 [Hevea brasiliensis]|uniref:Uncharacterized protein n=1 Tax=Hevea brasiliensis TaxID=3981 RepID=A0A6A6N0Q4_HEVBR|nr:hypothetical protein GH714_018808 [Hevea brasiliensis]
MIFSSQALGNLKLLNLSNSLELTRVPDLTRFPNLEVLRLSECRSLIEIPSSIGELKCLKEINLMRCSKLHSIPQGICNLKSLTLLRMSDCLNVTELPENIGDLEFLETLDILDSGIKALRKFEIFIPQRLFELTRVPDLSSVPKLELLFLDRCRSLIEIPSSIGELKCFKEIYVIGAKNCKVFHKAS